MWLHLKKRFSALFGFASGLIFGYLVVGFLESWTHQTMPVLWSVVAIAAFFGLAGLGIGVMSPRGIIVGDAILLGFWIFSSISDHVFSPNIFYSTVLGEVVFFLSV